MPILLKNDFTFCLPSQTEYASFNVFAAAHISTNFREYKKEPIIRKIGTALYIHNSGSRICT